MANDLQDVQFVSAPTAMVWGFQSLLPHTTADAAVFAFGLLLQQLGCLHVSQCDQLHTGSSP
eukprot:7567722-Karenia_brevis.AAC.1